MKYDSELNEIRRSEYEAFILANITEFEEVLRLAFLTPHETEFCSEEERRIFAGLLKKLGETDSRSLAWYMLLAVISDDELFSEDDALELMMRNKDALPEYRRLLLQELNESLDDEAVDTYLKYPFLWAARNIVQNE